MSSQEYAGVLEFRDGKLVLPDKYAAATQFVIRTRWSTSDWRSGAGIDAAWWNPSSEAEEEKYGVQNPHLNPEEVTLKIYGEDEERYRVPAEALDE